MYFYSIYIFCILVICSICQTIASAEEYSNVIYTQVATTNFAACGLTTRGTVECWGTKYASVGLGKQFGTVPIPQTETDPVVEIIAGELHICAISKDRKLYCWGSNHVNQLGPNAGSAHIGFFELLKSNDIPRARSNVKDVCLGTYHTIFINDDDTIGVFGFEGTIEHVKDFKVKQIACGKNYVCALTLENEVRCSGTNSYSLGLGEGNNKSSEGDPVLKFGDAQPQPKIKQIAAGLLSSLALDENGDLWGWGRNAGALGLNTNNRSALSPEKVNLSDLLEADDAIERIVTGADTTCLVTNHSKLLCSGALMKTDSLNGNNRFIRVDFGDNFQASDVAIPTSTGGFEYVNQDYGDNVFLCAVNTINMVKCFGNNTLDIVSPENVETDNLVTMKDIPFIRSKNTYNYPTTAPTSSPNSSPTSSPMQKPINESKSPTVSPSGNGSEDSSVVFIVVGCVIGVGLGVAFVFLQYRRKHPPLEAVIPFAEPADQQKTDAEEDAFAVQFELQKNNVYPLQQNMMDLRALRNRPANDVLAALHILSDTFAVDFQRGDTEHVRRAREEEVVHKLKGMSEQDTVFFSHASKDNEIVRGILNSLRRKIPNIEADISTISMNNVRDLESQVQQSKFICILLTDNFVMSKWCILETILAIENNATIAAITLGGFDYPRLRQTITLIEDVIESK